MGIPLRGVHARPLTIRVRLHAQQVASSTRLIELGGYHVALDTVLLSARLPLELHSADLGHPAMPTRATHLTIAPGHADTHVVEHDHAAAAHARERCLLDHLQVLVELANELGHTLSVELPDHDVALTGPNRDRRHDRVLSCPKVPDGQ